MNTSALDATYSSGTGITDAVGQRAVRTAATWNTRPPSASAHQRMWMSARADDPPAGGATHQQPDADGVEQEHQASPRASGSRGATNPGTASTDDGGTADTRTARRGRARRAIRSGGSPAAAAAIDCRRTPVSLRRSLPPEGGCQDQCERGQAGEAKCERCGSAHWIRAPYRVRSSHGGPHDGPVSWCGWGPVGLHSDVLRLCGRPRRTLHPRSVP